ncbi:MAG: hypothetical protein ACN6RK_03405 [Stenotrophomonas sp.]
MNGVSRSWRHTALKLAAGAALSLWTSVALAAPSLFEGLQWGATEAQLREVFGDKLKLLPCSDAQRQAETGPPDRKGACDSPYVEDYTIDGITFLAIFNMGGEGKTLNTIYLDRGATVTNAQIRKGEGAEFRYNRVKRVLAQRHGEPSEINETSRRPKNELVTLHVKWIIDDTVISMTNTIIPDPRGQMYYLGLVYKPLAEAMKPLASLEQR